MKSYDIRPGALATLLSLQGASMGGIIDRRGQKVVCIDDNWPAWDQAFCAQLGVAMPIAGKTYIVDDFFRCPGCGQSHHICLVGHSPKGGMIGFVITSFAPVDFRETDISDLVELAAKQTALPQIKVPLVTVDRFAASLGRVLASASVAAFITKRLGLALPSSEEFRRHLGDASEG